MNWSFNATMMGSLPENFDHENAKKELELATKPMNSADSPLDNLCEVVDRSTTNISLSVTSFFIEKRIVCDSKLLEFELIFAANMAEVGSSFLF